jgi:beta,beta-carotene 9',10'-dioxygenase
VRIDALLLEGTLPPWLAETLLRNDPARFTVGSDSCRHWFDGLAVLHGLYVGSDVVCTHGFLRSPVIIARGSRRNR